MRDQFRRNGRPREKWGKKSNKSEQPYQDPQQNRYKRLKKKSMIRDLEEHESWELQEV
ncbi:MAG TPA: hypothetical protein PLF13_01745 [candidate division Zixibacteria bacterium]|nr:hypothetical protein [candidate division Zixibacteria bacterium]